MYIADVATFFRLFADCAPFGYTSDATEIAFKPFSDIYGAKRRPVETARLPTLNVASRTTFSPLKRQKIYE